MTELKLYETLKEAWETSTQNYNRFEEVINSINWTDTYEADGEMYFCKGKFTLTVENVDPFKEAWKPEVMFSDHSMIEF